jgi:ketosteroid isomerase-like protein
MSLSADHSTDPALLARAGDLLYAYAAAIDSLNAPAVGDLVAEDVKLDRGHETIAGRAAVVRFYQGFAESGVQTSQHMITNVRVTGGEGGFTAYAAFLALATGDFGARVTWGRYEDEVVADDANRLWIQVKRIQVTRSAVVPETLLAAVGAPAFVPRNGS